MSDPVRYAENPTVQAVLAKRYAQFGDHTGCCRRQCYMCAKVFYAGLPHAELCSERCNQDATLLRRKAAKIAERQLTCATCGEDFLGSRKDAQYPSVPLAFCGAMAFVTDFGDVSSFCCGWPVFRARGWGRMGRVGGFVGLREELGATMAGVGGSGAIARRRSARRDALRLFLWHWRQLRSPLFGQHREVVAEDAQAHGRPEALKSAVEAARQPKRPF